MIEIKEPYGFVYITTNIINGKRYIGQKNFDIRNEWNNYLGSGKILIQSIKRYGRNNFTRDIVEIAYSKEELNELEKEWINNYNAVDSDDFYNLVDGGKANCPFFNKTQEEKNKIAKKISKSSIGKKMSKEARKKNSLSKIGKKLSKKTKNKMRESKKGIKLPDIAIAKSVEKNSKKVICLTTRKIFISLAEASRFYKASKGRLTLCCQHKAYSCGKNPLTGEKLRWMYYEEYIKQNQLLIHNESLVQAI